MINLELIIGDAVQKLKEMEASSVDLIIADPPYNLGKNYQNNIDNKTFEEYLYFSKECLLEASRVLKSHGTIYVFMGFRFISYLYNILERDLNLHFHGWIVWHYTQGIGKTKVFSPRHDDILMFTKSPAFTFNLDDIRVPQKYYRQRNNMRGANPGDVWKFSHVHYSNPNRQGHPTQKPEGLIERMVLASSNAGDTILDPFTGSGTTVRVCQQLNRNAIGIDINPKYIEMAKIRLSEPFLGFDSVDPRMERVPNDLRNAEIRSEYLKNHVNWFLRNHKNAIDDFQKAIKDKYGITIDENGITVGTQKSLF